MVLTDINMTEMEDIILLNEIHEVDQTMKAVVLSAYSGIKNIITAMKFGAFNFLPKPINSRILQQPLMKN